MTATIPTLTTSIAVGPGGPYGAGDRGRLAERRRRLHELDDCLGLLEDAHERDEQLVSPAVSALIAPHVAGIAPVMLITEALELVFREQEVYLAPEDDPEWARDVAPRPVPRPVPGPVAQPAAGVAGPLDATSARALTDRIKASANQVSLLLLEAHEGRAWVALGYRTWEHYVRQELGLSRTRSYELLDHGRLIRSIHTVTGTTAVPDIPPYAARCVKPRMAEFVVALRSKVQGQPVEEMPALIDEALRDHRQWDDAGVARSRPATRNTAGATAITADPDTVVWAAQVVQAAAAGHGWHEELDMTLLWAAVDCLAAMPPVPSVVYRAADEARMRRAALECAIEWLTEFLDTWKALVRPSGQIRYPLPRGTISGVARPLPVAMGMQPRGNGSRTRT